MCHFNSAVHVFFSPTRHSVKRSVSCEQNYQLLQIRNQIQPSTNDRFLKSFNRKDTKKEFMGLCRHGCICVCVVYAYIKHHCSKQVFAYFSRDLKYQTQNTAQGYNFYARKRICISNCIIICRIYLTDFIENSSGTVHVP